MKISLAGTRKRSSDGELKNTFWQLLKFPLKHVHWVFLSVKVLVVKGLVVKVCKSPDTVKRHSTLNCTVG